MNINMHTICKLSVTSNSSTFFSLIWIVFYPLRTTTLYSNCSQLHRLFRPLKRAMNKFVYINYSLSDKQNDMNYRSIFYTFCNATLLRPQSWQCAVLRLSCAPIPIIVLFALLLSTFSLLPNIHLMHSSSKKAQYILQFHCGFSCATNEQFGTHRHFSISLYEILLTKLLVVMSKF